MIDRASLARRYARVRARTEALAAPLSPEDAMVQSMPDASPAKWHLAHTAWFFEEFVLARHAPAHPWHDERWRVLFNSYYEAVGPRHARPARGVLSRPSLDAVRGWRAWVDDRVLAMLPGAGEAALEAVLLGTHHEEQHQELLLTDIQHALHASELHPAYTDRPLEPSPPGSADAAPLAWAAFDEAVVDLGHAGSGFAFDNETPSHRALVG
ncbi:MAG TPA: DinB family protein, partial [Polyangiaceae bacterium]|nr:DinB family protein [Polyangiaceae bacterium]